MFFFSPFFILEFDTELQIIAAMKNGLGIQDWVFRKWLM